MVKTVVFIYSLAQDIVILLSFIFSLVYLKKILGNSYLKLFPLYTLVSLIVDFIFYFNKPLGTLTVNLFVLFEFLIFYNFYWKIFTDTKNQKILIILFFAYLIFLVIMLLMYFDRYNLTLIKLLKKRTFLEMIAMSNILIAIPPIIYYKSLFSLPIKKLKKEPIFLIMTGILFGMSLTIPIDAMYLLIRSYSKAVFVNLYILNALGYILMHLFIIKAYLTLK